MKTKLKFLIKQSLKKKIQTKWFKIANIIIFLMFIGIFNIDRIVSFFGGDFSETKKIYVIDEVNAYDIFETNFKEIAKSLEEMKNYEVIKSTDNIDKLKEDITNDKKEDVIISIKKSEEYISGNVVSYDTLDTITSQLIMASLNNVKSTFVLVTSGLSEQEIMALTSNVTIDKEVLNPDSENKEGKDIVSSGLAFILTIPFFLLITMLTQMIGAEINDEKSTRSMEIIISNVPPKIHFASKVISSTIFILLQFLLLLLFGGCGFLLRLFLNNSLGTSQESLNFFSDTLDMIKNTGVLELLKVGAPILIILFLISFLAYAILAGVLASMTTNMEDYQQLQTPLMLVLLAGYYIAMMASTFEGALFIKIVGFIPMLSFLVAPIIYLLGQITLLELILSTIICGVFTYLLFHFGLKIYKVGILNYSSQDLWKKIFKSIKN